MADDELTEQVKRAVSDALSVDLDWLHASAVLGDDLGADEFDVVEIVLELERVLGIVVGQTPARG